MRLSALAFLATTAFLGIAQIYLPAFGQSAALTTRFGPTAKQQFPLLCALSQAPATPLLPSLSPVVLENSVGQAQYQSSGQNADQNANQGEIRLASATLGTGVLEALSQQAATEGTAPQMAVSQATETNDQAPQLRGAGENIAIPQAISKKPIWSAKHSVLGTLYKNAKETLERNFGIPGYYPPITAPLARSAPPAPLDPVFPSTEFIGTDSQAPMGVNDNNNAQYPLELMLWKACPVLAKNRIRVYGWLNPGYNYGTSRHNNFPMSYIVAARQLHWDQIVLRFERVPDTVQHEHKDWGFRFTSLYGEDYRFTLAKGWVSNQLLKYNNLTGWDPCECFGLLYVPKIFGKKIFDGCLVRCGAISLAQISKHN